MTPFKIYLKTLWTASVIATVLLSPAAQAQQQLVPANSSISFTSRQMGVPVDGQFKKFEAQIAFDPAQVAQSRIHFSIDMGSATLGSAETDTELMKPLWFNTAQFPKATFQSTNIKALSPQSLQVTGLLRMKGVEQTITVPVQLQQNGRTTTATGQFTLQRLALKIGEQEWADTSMVANDVVVRFKLALTGIAALAKP